MFRNCDHKREVAINKFYTNTNLFEFNFKLFEIINWIKMNALQGMLLKQGTGMWNGEWGMENREGEMGNRNVNAE